MEKSSELNAYRTFSEEDKKSLKIDAASFKKRMSDRLKRIQGDQSTIDAGENFLLRHRYADANSL